MDFETSMTNMTAKSWLQSFVTTGGVAVPPDAAPVAPVAVPGPEEAPEAPVSVLPEDDCWTLPVLTLEPVVVSTEAAGVASAVAALFGAEGWKEA